MSLWSCMCSPERLTFSLSELLSVWCMCFSSRHIGNLSFITHLSQWIPFTWDRIVIKGPFIKLSNKKNDCIPKSGWESMTGGGEHTRTNIPSCMTFSGSGSSSLFVRCHVCAVLNHRKRDSEIFLFFFSTWHKNITRCFLLIVGKSPWYTRNKTH